MDQAGTVLARRRLPEVSSVGDLLGPAVVGEGIADLPAYPLVRVVVAGLESPDHSRDDPGRGRAVRKSSRRRE